MAGAAVSARVPGVDRLDASDVTDGEGRYALALLETGRQHELTVEKEGFASVTRTLEPPLASERREDFELLRPEEVAARRAGEADPARRRQATAVYNQGTEAFAMGDLALARERFEAAVSLDPGLDAGWVALAKIAYQEQDMARVVELSERALAAAPAHREAHELRIAALRTLGRSDRLAEAEREYAAAVPGAGDDLAARAQLADGIRAYNGGDNAAAEAHFREALEIDPELAKAHYMLGLCLSGTDAAAAREHLEAFLRLAPDDADAETAREMLRYLE